MSTPTPRTNRAWNTLGDENAEAAWSFARTLERELHESRNAERLARVQLGNEREKVQRLVEINEFVGSAQLKAEREKVRMLRSALENLRDEQNGAPLERSRGQWQMAMDEAGLALAVTEDTP
jgi:YesN/AraC family two-component response regulator